MSDGLYRGVVHDGMVVIENGSSLAEGTEVVVAPVLSSPGSPAAVLAAVEAAPRVPAEWVDELEQLIAQGSRPAVRSERLSNEWQVRETEL